MLRHARDAKRALSARKPTLEQEAAAELFLLEDQNRTMVRSRPIRAVPVAATPSHPAVNSAVSSVGVLGIG